MMIAGKVVSLLVGYVIGSVVAVILWYLLERK